MPQFGRARRGVSGGVEGLPARFGAAAPPAQPGIGLSGLACSVGVGEFFGLFVLRDRSLGGLPSLRSVRSGGHSPVKTGRSDAETPRMRVLLVEDDADIAAPLVRGLEREGFEVTHHATGGAALEASEGPDAPDVVLLDLGLPDLDGFEVCRRMRSGSEVPIIVVTARGDEVDRVVGLELGADDYVVKPFGMRELVARIRAVARRAPARAADSPVIEIEPLVVDRRARRVTMAGEELLLTPKEFDLLGALAEDPGAACSRQHLLDVVWDPHWYGPTKTVDVHVANLRRKLGDARWIETVRGVGYRLADPGAIP